MSLLENTGKRCSNKKGRKRAEDITQRICLAGKRIWAPSLPSITRIPNNKRPRLGKSMAEKIPGDVENFS